MEETAVDQDRATVAELQLVAGTGDAIGGNVVVDDGLSLCGVMFTSDVGSFLPRCSFQGIAVR